MATSLYNFSCIENMYSGWFTPDFYLHTFFLTNQSYIIYLFIFVSNICIVCICKTEREHLVYLWHVKKVIFVFYLYLFIHHWFKIDLLYKILLATDNIIVRHSFSSKGLHSVSMLGSNGYCILLKHNNAFKMLHFERNPLIFHVF